MTNQFDSENIDDASVSSNLLDSLFDMPPLASRSALYDSSLDEETDDDTGPDTPPLASSDEEGSVLFGDSTDDESFAEANSTTASTVLTVPSVASYSVESLSPPPPGSVMELWDTPFSTSILHDLSSPFKDAKCYNMEADYNSDSTLDYPGDDDESYCEFNPTVPHPILSLSRVSATPQVIGLDSVSSAATMSKMGELIDTGGNFNMTNSLNTLVNVRRIKPFSIGMAAQESKSSSMCTHRGDFLIPMKDVTIFYTPMFYNAKALDCILFYLRSSSAQPVMVCSFPGNSQVP
jgi:hypothetical protein